MASEDAQRDADSTSDDATVALAFVGLLTACLRDAHLVLRDVHGVDGDDRALASA